MHGSKKNPVGQNGLRPFDIFLIIVSVFAFGAACQLAMRYVNSDNPESVAFVLRKDTYDKLLPFLLGTVAVGAGALLYNRVQQEREKSRVQMQVEKMELEARIKSLQEIYDTVLVFFQNIKLQRRRLRLELIEVPQNGTWKMRRNLFEDIMTELNDAQLTGERIIRTLDFQQEKLGERSSSDDERQQVKSLWTNMKSQIGGIQGVLRNVLRSAEWQSVTSGAQFDEDLVDVPSVIIKFADSRTNGNMSFGTLCEYFDSFGKNVNTRIHILEDKLFRYRN
jgi:hypothetical protein